MNKCRFGGMMLWRKVSSLLKVQRLAIDTSFVRTLHLEKHQIAQHRKDCATLNVDEDCTESTARNAYILMAKKYHPDSGTPFASEAKFKQIDEAYKNLLKRFADSRHNLKNVEGEFGLYYDSKRKKEEPSKKEQIDFDIEHTAPQHRTYLSFEGVGSGTPSQRQKQYTKYRTVKIVENLVEHRINQATKETVPESSQLALAKDRKQAKKIRTGIGIERLVEDKIQESMSRGEFDNLSGKGKPLKESSGFNPYIDYTTHKMNQVLIENGFMPEWIMLEKEIDETKEKLLKSLEKKRHEFPEKLNDVELIEWKKYLISLEPQSRELNQKILNYNLTVPSMRKQKMGFVLSKVGEKALKMFQKDKFNPRKETTCSETKKNVEAESEPFLSYCAQLFFGSSSSSKQ